MNHGHPLLLAVEAGRKEITELLLTKGADLKAKTAEGKTALQIATQKDYKEIVELLRKHGAKE